MIFSEALVLEWLRQFVEDPGACWPMAPKPDLYEDALWLAVWGKHSAQRAFLAAATAELHRIEEGVAA